MTTNMKNLLLGALKSAVSGAAGLVIALPLTDPTKFSISTLGGWAHLGQVILIVTVVSEARFWKQWADASSSGNTTPPPSTGTGA